MDHIAGDDKININHEAFEKKVVKMVFTHITEELRSDRESIAFVVKRPGELVQAIIKFYGEQIQKNRG